MYTSNDRIPATRARIIPLVAWELTSGANACRYAAVLWLERVTERWAYRIHIWWLALCRWRDEQVIADRRRAGDYHGYALAQAAYWRRWTRGDL